MERVVKVDDEGRGAVAAHRPGEVVTMASGRVYEVQADGSWRRLGRLTTAELQAKERQRDEIVRLREQATRALGERMENNA